MTKTEIENARNWLEGKKAELEIALHEREGIVVEKSADSLDQIVSAGERELVIRNLDRDSNSLRMIRRALARIEAGDYGVCMHCEEDIKPKRINAIKWAAYCLKCQGGIERQEIEPEDPADFIVIA